MLRTKLDRVLLLGCFLLSLAFYGTYFFKIVYFQIFLGEMPLNWSDANHNWFATYSSVFSRITESNSIFVLLALFLTHAVCTLLPFFALRTVARWIQKGQ